MYTYFKLIEIVLAFVVKVNVFSESDKKEGFQLVLVVFQLVVIYNFTNFRG